jgi:hypothetical protein
VRNQTALVAAATSLDTSIVYAVRVGEFVKIGYTNGRLSSRLSHFRVNCPYPCELLAIMPGGRKEERMLHRHLESSRAHGEWFRDNQQVRAWVDQFMSVTQDEFYRSVVAAGAWPTKKEKLLRRLTNEGFFSRKPSTGHGALKEMA